jgi:hypothetical protein
MAGGGGSESTSGTAGGGMAGMAGGGGAGGVGGGGAGGGGASGGSTCTAKVEVCDGLDNDCDEVPDQGQTCAEGCTGASFAGHSYAFCGDVESGTAAFTKCQSMGLGVVMIESATENDFIASTMKSSSWLGATDTVMEGRWVWYHNGTVFWNKKPVDGQYQNWLALNPNDNNLMGLPEDCAVILSGAASKGQWNDLSCDIATFNAACESLDPVP